MADMAGVSFGDFQSAVDQVTRILPTAAVTGFHFVSSQISPDGTCCESQRIAYAVFTVIFSILCAILAVVDRQQAPRRIAAAAQGKIPPKKTTNKRTAPKASTSPPPPRSRTPKRAAAQRALQSTSPTRSPRGTKRTMGTARVHSASPPRLAGSNQGGRAEAAAALTSAGTLAENNLLQYTLRAVGSGLTFACIAVMTAPGPTCLFGSFGLPRWMTSSVCGTIILLFGSLVKLPGFAPTVQTGQAQSG